MPDAPLSIIPENTPNPNSTKYNVNRTLLKGAGRDYPNAAAAKASPLASELFMLPNVAGVYIGSNFVTVSTTPGNDWGTRPLVTQALESFLNSGKPVVAGSEQPEAPQARAWTEIETGIIRVLENEIRPAVAMDGGDIVFERFEKGVVKLHLRGSCHSCPSSVVTLKAGIENRLKQEFPEIVAVEAI